LKRAAAAVGQPDAGRLDAEQALDAPQAAVAFPARLQSHGVDDGEQAVLAAIGHDGGIEERPFDVALVDYHQAAGELRQHLVEDRGDGRRVLHLRAGDAMEGDGLRPQRAGGLTTQLRPAAGRMTRRSNGAVPMLTIACSRGFMPVVSKSNATNGTSPMGHFSAGTPAA
jgi:hypothetical protein